jgi:hypothetical protein
MLFFHTLDQQEWLPLESVVNELMTPLTEEHSEERKSCNGAAK